MIVNGQVAIPFHFYNVDAPQEQDDDEFVELPVEVTDSSLEGIE